MEVRVHGIGGTSAQSMLGDGRDAALVPRWPTGRKGTPHLWTGSPGPEVVAYHWALLTSGSRRFVLWPLALPFTLLNVAGFMHPPGRIGAALRAFHRLLCLLVTVWFATWFVFGGQEVATAKGWTAFGGWMGAALVALLVLAPSVSRARWAAGRVRADDLHRPGVDRRRAPLEDPDFFQPVPGLWVVHVAALAATAVAVATRRWWDDRVATLDQAARRSVVDVGMGIVVVVAVMLVLTLVSQAAQGRRPWAWAFSAMGVIGVGASLVGGLTIALLRVVVGDGLHGTPYVLFDIYGIAVLAGLSVGGGVAVLVMARRSPGELLPRTIARRVLPDPMSWFRARVAQLPRAGAAAIGAAVVTFVVVGIWQFIARAPATSAEWAERLRVPEGVRDALGIPSPATVGDAVSEGAWRLTGSPTATIAQVVLYGVFVAMVVNLVKSHAAPDALRRVGSVWDVLTFWPRTFHPFAVRPYSECAVDQLRQLLFTGIDDDWPDRIDVVAHSQGSMLVVAALAPGAAPGAQRRSLSRVGHLVTVGSPLRSLYMSAFPHYVTEDTIVAAATALAPRGAWTNVFRYTDHVGRTVFADESGWTPVPTRPPAGEPQERWWRDQEIRHRGHLRMVRECAIADPAARQGRIQGHNDYWNDPRVRKEVDRVVI